MLTRLKYCIYVVVAFQMLAVVGFSQERKTTNSSAVTRYNYAPDLYADKLNFRATLVNLPGSDTAKSNWQTSYMIYFVPEADFDNSISKIGRREPVAGDFSEKILLASGEINKTSLRNISERVVEKNAIKFNSKISKASKTEFAKIIVFYSVKIYDAKLKQNILRSSLFITPPFNVDSSNKQPRRNLYLNFFVTDGGKLFTSNQERLKSETNW